MAKILCEHKIKTTVIADAAVFALMARVDKVNQEMVGFRGFVS